MSRIPKVIDVVGARPHFMKVAPVVEAMGRRTAEFAPLVVHNGQHYDDNVIIDSLFKHLERDRPGGPPRLPPPLWDG